MGVRVAEWMERNSGLMIVIAVAITIVLVFPFLLMKPDEMASDDPGGEVYDTLVLADERFSSRAYFITFIVEAVDGDLLRKEPLQELLANEQSIRDDPKISSKLFSYFSSDLMTDVEGIYTIADAVDVLLRHKGLRGIAEATDLQVRTAVNELVEQYGPRRLGLSIESTRDVATQHWIAPALIVTVLADNEALGGGGQRVVLGSDSTVKEEFSRLVQTRLRGSQGVFQAWGVAIDVNLTSNEQGSVAGPFIGLTIFAVLLFVAMTYRSYWTVAIVGGALASMIIWLKGLSNLVGLKDSLILSLIVPIAMVSFGIDFAIHALGRYREARCTVYHPRRAFVTGFGAVLAALLLALISDAVAFLSNLSSGIESVVQFGLGAALGLVATFVMLGIVVPLASMRVDQRLGIGREPFIGRTFVVLASVVACVAVVASVLFSVFLVPWLGVLVLGLYILVFLLVPYLLAGRLPPGAGATGSYSPVLGSISGGVGKAVARLVRFRFAVLAITVGVTGVASYFAFHLSLESDVRIFLSSDTDFVVGLDKLDRHIGSSAGEPAQIYIEADLEDPKVILAIREFATQVRTLETDRFARASDGHVLVDLGAIELIQDVLDSVVAREAVELATEVVLSDQDGDAIPDSREQIAAIYRFVRDMGVPLDQQRYSWTPDSVRTVLWVSADSSRQATRVSVQIVGSRAQENVVEARRQLAPLVDDLQSKLRGSNPDASVVLSGGPIARQESLDSVTRALRVSLPIAVVLCLAVGAVFMRSIKFAFVTVIPIILVVVWLYAFMYMVGFGINLVTATIAAISIGIGVDFAVHFTMRYREELLVTQSRTDAIEAAASGSGVALVASAVSSAIGFAILGFAPMPLFSSYGLLTAVMILMAAVSSLLILPSLLTIVTSDQA